MIIPILANKNDHNNNKNSNNKINNDDNNNRHDNIGIRIFLYGAIINKYTYHKCLFNTKISRFH